MLHFLALRINHVSIYNHLTAICWQINHPLVGVSWSNRLRGPGHARTFKLFAKVRALIHCRCSFVVVVLVLVASNLWPLLIVTYCCCCFSFSADPICPLVSASTAKELRLPRCCVAIAPAATGYHRAMQGALKPSPLMCRKLKEVGNQTCQVGLDVKSCWTMLDAADKEICMSIVRLHL